VVGLTDKVPHQQDDVGGGEDTFRENDVFERGGPRH
jgi:hypothetical protein